MGQPPFPSNDPSGNPSINYDPPFEPTGTWNDRNGLKRATITDSDETITRGQKTNLKAMPGGTCDNTWKGGDIPGVDKLTTYTCTSPGYDPFAIIESELNLGTVQGPGAQTKCDDLWK